MLPPPPPLLLLLLPRCASARVAWFADIEICWKTEDRDDADDDAADAPVVASFTPRTVTCSILHDDATAASHRNDRVAESTPGNVTSKVFSDPGLWYQFNVIESTPVSAVSAVIKTFQKKRKEEEEKRNVQMS